MKILFKGYDTVAQNPGSGLANRIRRTEEEVRRRGMETELFGEFSSRVEDCDILHVFSLDFQNYQVISWAKQKKKKIVLSSVLNCEQAHLADFFRLVGNRLPLPVPMQLRFRILRAADAVVTETEAEKRFLRDHYGVPEAKMTAVPNGVEPWDEADIGREIFDRIGDADKYALVVGRFDPNKNQLNVIRALKNTGVHTVFIGGPDHLHPDYYQTCLSEAKGDGHFHFLGWVGYQSPLMRSAYRWADTMIVPSHQETFGLSLLEGGAMGAKLCVSKTLPILEYGFVAEEDRFDPKKPEEIRETALRVLNRGKDSLTREKIAALFSWEKVTDRLADIYHKVLSREE